MSGPKVRLGGTHGESGTLLKTGFGDAHEQEAIRWAVILTLSVHFFLKIEGFVQNKYTIKLIEILMV